MLQQLKKGTCSNNWLLITGGCNLGFRVRSIQWVDDWRRLRSWWKWKEKSSQTKVIGGRFDGFVGSYFQKETKQKEKVPVTSAQVCQQT